MEILGAGMPWTKVLEAACKQRGKPRVNAAELGSVYWDRCASRVSETTWRQHELSVTLAVIIQKFPGNSPPLS